MDCRKFNKNLEDYLEDGLDFAGRFGMERHARQCISCGEELAGAQRLRRMAHELNRVKAPANFESSLLNEIAKSKGQGRFSYFRKFWLYGFELQSPRRLALVGSVLAVLVIGIFYLSPHLSRRPATEVSSAAKPVAPGPAKAVRSENPQPAATTVAAQTDRPLPRQAKDMAETTQISIPDQEPIVERETEDTDYVELEIIGPDKRPVSFRLPDKPRVRDGQAAQQYYVRYESH